MDILEPLAQPAASEMSGLFSNADIIIPAAGRGERLGLGPKALLELDGLSLLTWVSRKVLKFCNEVFVAVPPGSGNRFHSLCTGCCCIEGGPTRQETVRRLMEACNRDWIVIADVTRPFASPALFFSVLKKAHETGIAGAFLNPDVPVARIVENRVVQDFQRHEVGEFQSQQAFSRVLLKKIYMKARTQKWEEQTTIQLALRAGEIVGTVPGEKTNIKITTPEDWQIARFYKDYLR